MLEQVSIQDFFFRPDFISGKALTTCINLAVGICVKAFKPARNNSLFFTATPSFRQIPLSALSALYSS
jgi:hypothetical protein